MKITKSEKQRVSEQALKCVRALLGGAATARNLMIAYALIASANLCLAGYIVDSHVESAGGTNYYSWVLYNEDQSWGLDGFAVEVPVQTRVLARTVPPPHANPDHTARWIMEEHYESSVDQHDGRVTISAPRPGMKWLFWWGVESPSVYPPGTTVIFSVATDGAVGPGLVAVSAATYTPQNNPHYYRSWQGQVIGPGCGVGDTAPSQAENAAASVHQSFRTSLVTNLENSAIVGKATPGTPVPATSVALHAAVTIEGKVGERYGIQVSTQLGDTNQWRGLANILLSTPSQVWYDPEPVTNLQRYYRVVSGPVSIP